MDSGAGDERFALGFGRADDRDDYGFVSFERGLNLTDTLRDFEGGNDLLEEGEVLCPKVREGKGPFAVACGRYFYCGFDVLKNNLPGCRSAVVYLALLGGEFMEDFGVFDCETGYGIASIAEGA